MTSFGYTILGFGVNANPVAATPSIVSSGLILHYDAGNTDSYPGSGTTWSNLISDNHDGTLENGPTFSSDDGGSIVFDGSDELIECADDLDPEADGLFADSGHAWSASAWFNVSDSGSLPNRGAIISRSVGAGGQAQFSLYYESRTSGGGGRTGSQVEIRLRGTKTIINDTDITGTWSNVAVTWDGTTAKTYFNGSFVTNAGVGTRSEQVKTFRVGNTHGAGGGDKPFKGNISVVKVYEDALTAAEVLQNYNALKGRYGL